MTQEHKKLKVLRQAEEEQLQQLREAEEEQLQTLRETEEEQPLRATEEKVSTDILDAILDKAGLFPIVPTNLIDPTNDVHIIAYWNKRLVVITYPDSKSKWCAWEKREDCGSHSQHRWGLHDKERRECAQLVATHNACLNSVFLQELCRNCQFRHVWRKSCLTPQNLFYIIPLVNISKCEALLDSLIISQYDTRIDVLSAYEKTLPKAVLKIKKIRSTTKKRKHLDKLENDIREAVRRSNMRDKLIMTQEHKKLKVFRQAEEEQLQTLREAEEEQLQTLEKKEEQLREAEEEQLQTLQEAEKEQPLQTTEEKLSTENYDSESEIGRQSAAMDEFATIKKSNLSRKRNRHL